MKITDIIGPLDLKIIAGHGGLMNDISGGYVSDLLSDVIGNAGQGSVWITLQIHNNIIAVASLKDISAIIIVKGAIPEEETVRKSNENNIPVLSTDKDTFTITGQLYELIKEK